ncbi:unnamed protein product [Ranitomeya imitator]|uniref:HAT C-terminal dimerisation domain-containing protein n=1 Tax=Ranitomeya imitator TaxID=111125 RepID=A0ABN9LM89_9NEOB|nr:unnamed protein product [Ranitomeya imitator]
MCVKNHLAARVQRLFPETCTLVTEEGEDGGEDEINWKDPAMWPDDIKDKEREKIVLSGLSNEEELKQMVKSLPKDVDDRSFSDFLLYAKSSNGREKFIRDWLRWSPSKKVMYCFTCMAFSDDKRSILCRKEGFNPMVSKWHRLYLKLPEHEHSALHRKHYWSWRTRQKAQVGHGVDFEMQRSLAKEAERLVALLERLLDVTLHLASRNMAFRGTSQRIGDLHNGNFLGTLEILSRYDSVLKEHLEKSGFGYILALQIDGRYLQVVFAPILKMTTISEENLVASTEELIAAYPQDLTSLLSELQHLRKVYEATFTDNMGPLDLLNAIYKFELQGIFGEVCIALRIFITLPLSVAEGERAFSKLSLVKNYLRSTMTEQRLNSLALLSIEHELTRRLNFKDLITDFAKQKEASVAGELSATKQRRCSDRHRLV